MHRTALVLLALATTLTASANSTSMIPEIPAGFEKPAVRDGLPPVQRNGKLPGTSADDRRSAEKGVAWLARNQRSDGGWAAGGWGGADAASDVATTAYVVRALRRSPSDQSKTVNAGIEFVIRAIETAPEGPRLNTPQGTQPQAKLGSLVDTFYAAALLGELLETNAMPAHLRTRANVAHDVVLGKVQAAQNANGSFSADGWAPVLATSVAMEALNSADRLGKKVDKQVLAKADAYNASLVGAGGVNAADGAGVPLYAVAGGLAASAEAESRARREGVAAAPAVSQAAKAGTAAVTGASADALIQGFGSAGGEEMLSYQLVSDTLAPKGGAEWNQWNDKIGGYLRSTQNQDGSWAGHHCITSAVFVTAGAVMTLTAGGPDAPRG